MLTFSDLLLLLTPMIACGILVATFALGLATMYALDWASASPWKNAFRGQLADNSGLRRDVRQAETHYEKGCRKIEELQDELKDAKTMLKRWEESLSVVGCVNGSGKLTGWKNQRAEIAEAMLTQQARSASDQFSRAVRAEALCVSLKAELAQKTCDYERSEDQREEFRKLWLKEQAKAIYAETELTKFKRPKGFQGTRKGGKFAKAEVSQ